MKNKMGVLSGSGGNSDDGQESANVGDCGDGGGGSS
jgi:hypothetical protein